MSKANKQQVPKVRFTGFNDSWTLKSINDIAKRYSGLTYTPNDVQNTGTFVIRSSNIQNDQFVDADNVYVNPAAVNCTYVQKNDVVVVVRNGSRNLIGKHAIINKEPANTVIGAFMSAFRTKQGGFLNALLSTRCFNSEVHKSLGATINQITGKDFDLMRFHMPLSPEQTQIGNFFQQLDKLIDLQSRAVASAETYKKAMLQKMFPQKGEKVPRVRFAGFSGDWKDVALGDLVDKSIKWSFVGGPFGSNLKAEDYTVEGVRVIQLQNIGDGEFIDDHHIYVSPEKADDLLSCNIYPNDILIAKMGDPVARCCIVPEFHDRYLMCSDGIRVVVDSSKYHSLFIYQSINLSSFREKAISAGTGSTRKRINLSDLKKLELSAPCLEEQAQIGNYFQKLDHNIEAEKKKLEQYQTMKRAMLQRMFV